MKSVAIIGAGITGLTAAFYLKRNGMPVTVYEASGRVGGVIQSLRQDGYLAEFGPNTILETSPKIAQLVRDAGLAVAPARSRSRRPRRATWSATAGPSRCRVRRWASSPRNCSPARPNWPCCANRSFRRAAMAWRKASRNSSMRRFNQEFLDHAIDALVGGHLRGRPYRLSVHARVPQAQGAGGQIRFDDQGPDFRRPRTQEDAAKSPRTARRSFPSTKACRCCRTRLRASSARRCRLNTTVTRLTQTAAGWTR